MAGPGGATLAYGLFTDSGFSKNWNATGAGTQAGTGNGAPQQLTVYGQIPAGQFVSPGAYADTITASVTY
jgi:spore coat protein U-like protein